MAKPKRNRTKIKKDLQEVINELVRQPCTFWACPGPNKPVVYMATCGVCWSIKELRKIRKEV